MSSTALHKAAYDGDNIAVQRLLDNDHNIQAENRWKDTPLHLAAFRGNDSVIKLLLEKGAKTEVTNLNGETPLHKATSSRKASSVKILLGANANPDSKTNHGDTPLHIAVHNKHTEVVQLLLDWDATVDIQDKNQHTPLHLATNDGNLTQIRILLRHKANIYNLNFSGNTGAHHAAYNGKKEVVKVLLDSGFSVNYQNKKGNTLLHHAVFEGHTELLDLLLEYKADTEIFNHYEETPLHSAITRRNRNILSVKKLIAAGANMYNKNRTGNTGAHHAAFNGKIDVLEVLLQSGFDVNCKNRDNNTLLHLAAREGHTELVSFLIAKKADPNIYNNNKNPPINLASRLGYTNIVNKLFQAGAKPNNEDGLSVLHAAATGNRLHTVQNLMTEFQDKINPNLLWEGKTPEDCANANGCSDITWWLRKQLKPNQEESITDSNISLSYCKAIYEKSGNDIVERAKKRTKRETDWIKKSIDDGQIEMHFMDKHGNTMLHKAAECGNIETVMVLVEHGALCTAKNFKNESPIDMIRGEEVYLKEYLQILPKSVSLNEMRISSDLYKTLLNITAQTVGLDTYVDIDPESSENIDKKVQKLKLEAVNIVSKLLAKSVTHELLGNCDRHLLPLAVTTNNKILLPVLLAAGFPLTTNDSGLGIVQLAWLTPELTIWVAMIVTRTVVHQLQSEQELLSSVNNERSPEMRTTSILLKTLQSLILELEGEKPSEAQFRSPDDELLTQLLVLACRHGATLTAWYIWKAGACVYERDYLSKCTALEAAISEKMLQTAFRLVVDMGANPFLKDEEGKLPIGQFPKDMCLLEVMLGHEYRSLEKLAEKAKEREDKMELQKIILILIVLFLQYNTDEKQGKWETFLTLLLKAYDMNQEDILCGSSIWIGKLENFLLKDGVCNIRFTPVQNVQKQINEIYKSVGLQSAEKNYIIDNTTDHFLSFYHFLHNNYNCFQIPSNTEVKENTHKDLLQKALKICCEKPFPLFLNLLVSLAKIDIECVLNEVCKTTPLHHAAKSGNTSAMCYLLQQNASPYTKDRSGILPLQYAFMFGYKTAGAILINHMEKNKDEIKKLGSYTLECHEKYLRIYDLNPDLIGRSQYLNVQSYENLLASRFKHVEKQWKEKGITQAATDIVVSYKEGESKEIKDSVTRLLKLLKEKIAEKDQLYDGDIEFVGSSEDNVRLYCPDEYDCNLLLRNVSAYPGKELEVTLTEIEPHKVSLCGHKQLLEVKPRSGVENNFSGGSDFLKKFYTLAKKSLIEMNLNDDKIKIMMPGIKRTQVGIALSFLWSGEEYPMLFIDVDFVPTVKALWPDLLYKPKCNLDPSYLQEVQLNNVGEDEWRLSFGTTETKIMKMLSDGRRTVFLVCKMILAAFKTEGWVPHKLKCDFMYWGSRMFPIPSKGGFALKNCFFQELEKITDDKEWGREKMMLRVSSVFERMCKIDSNETTKCPKPEKRNAKILECPKPVKAYFGGDTEKASIYLCAPEILRFLRSLDYSVIDRT